MSILEDCAVRTIRDYIMWKPPIKDVCTRQLLLVVLATYKDHHGDVAFRWVYKALRNFMTAEYKYQRQVILLAQLINGYHDSPGLNGIIGSQLRVKRRENEPELKLPQQR